MRRIRDRAANSISDGQLDYIYHFRFDGLFDRMEIRSQ